MKRHIVLTALDALAQETRLEVFRLLVQAGDAGLAVGAIAEKVGVPNATLSFHLMQLRHAALVSSTRKGTSLIYRANYDTMNRVISYLTENCCQGNPVEHCLPDEDCCRPKT